MLNTRQVKKIVFSSSLLSTPAPQENALEKAMQSFTPDKGRKEETALAARAKEDEPKGIDGWLAPLKKSSLRQGKTVQALTILSK